MQLHMLPLQVPVALKVECKDKQRDSGVLRVVTLRRKASTSSSNRDIPAASCRLTTTMWPMVFSGCYSLQISCTLAFRCASLKPSCVLCNVEIPCISGDVDPWMSTRRMDMSWLAWLDRTVLMLATSSWAGSGESEVARNVQFVDGKRIESMCMSMQISAELISRVGGRGRFVVLFFPCEFHDEALVEVGLAECAVNYPPASLA